MLLLTSQCHRRWPYAHSGAISEPCLPWQSLSKETCKTLNHGQCMLLPRHLIGCSDSLCLWLMQSDQRPMILYALVACAQHKLKIKVICRTVIVIQTQPTKIMQISMNFTYLPLWHCCQHHKTTVKVNTLIGYIQTQELKAKPEVNMYCL